MATSTFSSREFNNKVGEAKRAALDGPVFITDHGEPKHVLLTFEDFKAMNGKRHSIVDTIMAMPLIEGLAEVEFDTHIPSDFPRAAVFE
ncbi:MAG: type II toxin-antitoxin system Phd/YefM family antitoxin [Azoarcus sp.]|jgi:prevent-host-death family protein|nr:type II toxin-antitoxin system Phd/YefM family antitoxin [Azoarcus sp.]